MTAQPETSPQLTFRDASPNDWPQIARWISGTWDWGDYINAYVWMDWSARKSSAHLIVAESNSEIIGFCRLVMLAEAEWWLEGVRVAPEHRGHGVGKALVGHMVSLFKQVGNGILRFFTGSKNEPMRAVARDLGFLHRLSYTEMAAPAAPADIRRFRLLQPNNTDMVWQYLRYSPMYRANHFAERSWTAYFLTRDRLAGYLADSQVDVLGWRNQEQLHGITIVPRDPADRREGNPLRLAYLDAPDDTTLGSMLEALRGVALQRGQESVRWKMPLSVGLERPVEKTAYTREWEGALWLFERPIQIEIPT